MASAREPATTAPYTQAAGIGRPDPGDGALRANPAPPEVTASAERRMADALRSLAGSGPQVRLAEPAALLWTRFMRFDAADSRWPDRDRFVASSIQGAALQRALAGLSGQAGAAPELAAADAGLPVRVEHALGAAVGLALAERQMAARFGKSLVDHRTWLLAGDDDLTAGLSHEAASLASHLRLTKLTVLWDDSAESAGGDDHLRRFSALGWATKAVDGDDMAAMAAALSLAVRSKKPMLIACRGGADRPPAAPDDAVLARWRAAAHRGATARRGWLKRLQRHPLRTEFERAMAGRLPETWAGALAALRAEFAESMPVMASREAGRRALDALLPVLPELVFGSAEPEAAPNGVFAVRHIPYGARDHAAASCMNGLALHGGVLPGGQRQAWGEATCQCPALRDAASQRRRVLHMS